MMFVQGALWFHARQIAQISVDEGARATRAYNGTEADGEAATRQMWIKGKGNRVTEGGTPNPTVNRGAETVNVRLKTSAVKVIPIPGIKFNVEVVAGGPVERFVPVTP